MNKLELIYRVLNAELKEPGLSEMEYSGKTKKFS